jgi:hypothetical protein
MNANRFRKTVDGPTLAVLPELRPFSGQTVDVIVLEAGAPGSAPRQTFDAFLAGRTPWPTGRQPVSLEEMDAAIAAGASGDHA